jgi:hypothetical protein
VRPEAIELGAAQDTIHHVREQSVELVANHSVTGLFVFVIWHHITCL